MLRGFLKFAQSGGTDLDGADEQTPLNSFELDILDKLTAAGLDCVPQYGCSGYRIDFAVRHPTKPGQFALAVEADGASYHSSPTARDRDRLRQEHLERLGWRFCRIWSTDWFNDHRREVDLVVAAFGEAIADISEGARTPTASTAPSSDNPRDDESPDEPHSNADKGTRTPTALTLWPSDQPSEDNPPDEPNPNAPAGPMSPPPLAAQCRPYPGMPQLMSIHIACLSRFAAGSSQTGCCGQMHSYSRRSSTSCPLGGVVHVLKVPSTEQSPILAGGAGNARLNRLSGAQSNRVWVAEGQWGWWRVTRSLTWEGWREGR